MLQRVGNSKCVRCPFETDAALSFEEQDKAMMAHLEEKHPNWQTEPLVRYVPPTPSPETERSE